MDKLIKANLYRNELIPVSGKLVERYNRCLQKMGFLPSNLSKFSIDGLGWSPEIAAEKNNPFYLNNGDANPHAIIITPKQKGVPVYNPFHSFDETVMKTVFKTHAATIKDITRDSAICLDFDQGIDVFYDPLEVLKYTTINIRFHLIDNLKKAKADQQQLIELFLKDDNFIDEKIHQQIIASAKQFGDLRNRKVAVEVINFTTDSFYTKAFGGVYVLRDFVKPILVFEEEDAYKEAIKDTIHDVLLYHISHKELIEQLKNHSILELNLLEDVHSKRYKRIKKFAFAAMIEAPKHPKKEILEDPILFKSYLNKMELSKRKEVMGVEIYLDKKKQSAAVTPKDFISEELYVAMHKPHSSLKATHQDLIWKLLISIAEKDVLFLFWYNKERFYKVFATLDDAMQDWVIDAIRNNF